VVGRFIQISGRDHTIVGVAPKGFTGVGLVPVDVWLPLEASHQGDCLDMRGCWWMMAVARLATGVTVEAAEEEATRLHLNGRRDMVERGRYSEEARILLTSLIAAEGPDASAETHVARWLTGVSLIVLLIACANVANLLLARGTRQRREVAVRLALGVDRTRLMGHLMFESILLALSGGLVALLVARWGGGFVRSALLPGVYFPDSAVNGRVLAFAAVASVVAGVIAGLGPAIQSIRTDVSVDLAGGARGGSDRRSRLRGLLTVSQAAMSVVLLIGAGLFVRSLGELRSLDLGLDPDRLLLVNLELRSSNLDRADQIAVYEEAARRVEALPDVESAAFTSVPFQWGFATSLEVPGLDSIPTLPGGGPYYFPTSPGYFSTLGVGIVRGRALDASDTEGSQLVAVVSETMARTLWPGQEALGQCLMVGYGAEACTDVVGVAEDAARGGFQDRPFMAYYLPLEQVDDATPQGLYVRVARGDAATAAATVSPLLRSFSPLVRYANVRSFEEILDPLARSWTLGAAMFTIFGLLALCVAMIGLYSVLAFDVAQRTRELGIRMALGAAKRRLLVGILVSGGRLAVLGVVLGIGAAWLAAPYAGELLFETSPHDPWVIGVVALTLIGVAAVASILPGLRATRVDPMVALRSE
jgi:predicted permease